MLRIPRHKLILIALAASVAVFTLPVDAGREPVRFSVERNVEPNASAARANAHTLECRATKAALESELEQLRTRCDAAVAAFEACRASRPQLDKDWSDVELFSCSFALTTDLARGDLDDAASLEDCGTAPEASRPDATPTSSCPVPSCESDLELLEELKDRAAC